MKRDISALIKDLELQIDYLTGYSPQGLHWKQEWYFREGLIDNIINDEQTPPEIVQKISRIQNALFRLRKDKEGSQEYLAFFQKRAEKKAKKQINHPCENDHDHEILIHEIPYYSTQAEFALPEAEMDSRLYCFVKKEL